MGFLIPPPNSPSNGGGGGGGSVTQGTTPWITNDPSIVAALSGLATETTLLDVLNALGGTITVDGTVALDAGTLAALENITVTVSGEVEVSNDSGNPLSVVDTAAGSTLTSILNALNATIVGGDTVQVEDSALATLIGTGNTTLSNILTALGTPPEVSLPDPVNTRVWTALPYATTIDGPVTDEVLVAPPSGEQIRLRKFHLHADPALADGVYPVVTVSLGSVVVFSDKFEAGLPYVETFTLLGGVDDPITITTTTSARVFVNIRYETVV